MAKKKSKADKEEVAARQSDGDSGSQYEKEYVLLKEDAQDEDALKDHNGMVNKTRQEAINSGLRPTGDVSYDGQEDYGDGASVRVKYSVPVEPASKDDLAFEVNHAAASEARQEEIEDTL